MRIQLFYKLIFLTTTILLISVGLNLTQPSPTVAQGFSCATVSEIPQVECEALVALYNATDGGNWVVNSGWLSTNTPCSWFRIICESGHVVRVNPYNNGLVGTIPPEIGNLQYLNFLALSQNELSGSIPPEIGNLTNLTNIALYNNQLSGSIPAEIGNLINLEWLDLYSNQLSGNLPSELGNLTSLRIFQINNNQLTGSIPPELGNLSNLEHLQLMNNQFDGHIPPELVNLTNLTHLRLSGNQLSGNIPPELSNLSNLETLQLADNQLSGTVPSELGNLSNLTFFDLYTNDELIGSLPQALTNLSLNVFRYYDTNVCEPANSEFQQWLASIANLNNTGIVTCAPAAIMDLTAVTGSDVGQIEISWSAPQGIVTDMSYQIRHAGSAIDTELGWMSAIPIAGAPAPEPEGTIQSLLVANLTPGQTYYFAIRTEYGEGSLSGLSNSPGAIAKEDTDLGFRPDSNGYQFSNKQLWRTWEMFEQYFGSENVLKPDGSRCAAANTFFQNQYRTVANGWSCLGFSQTSLLSYLDWSQPNAGSFAIAHFEQLFQESESTQLTNPIAYYSGIQTAKQWGDTYRSWLNTCNTDPSEMVESIRRGIQNQQPVVVSLNTGIGLWHTLAPYRIEDISSTIVDIYVYDSEAPGQERIIRFENSGGNWQWGYTFVGSLSSAGTRTGGCNDTYPYALQTALEQGLPSVNFCQSSNSMNLDSSQTTAFSGKMLAHLPFEGDWVIQDSLGRRLGWVNGELISEIPDAYNIPQVLGDASLSFRTLELPEAEYSVTINDAITKTIEYYLFGDGRLIEVSGNLQSIGSSTTLSVTSNLDQATLSGLQNLDSFVMGFDNELATESQLATITGMPTSGDENLNASFNSGQMVISRTNGIMQYSLAFEKNDGQLFVSELLTLGANNTHTLRPMDWATLNTTNVVLEIDYDSDGTIDNVQVLTNQLNREFVYLPVVIRP